MLGFYLGQIVVWKDVCSADAFRVFDFIHALGCFFYLFPALNARLVFFYWCLDVCVRKKVGLIVIVFGFNLG